MHRSCILERSLSTNCGQQQGYRVPITGLGCISTITSTIGHGTTAEVHQKVQPSAMLICKIQMLPDRRSVQNEWKTVVADGANPQQNL